MDGEESIRTLYRHAAECEFHKFSELLAELICRRPDRELANAYLFRAQIKLCASDESFSEDLKKAAAVSAAPGFPCLNTQWLSDSPNRFLVFSKTPGGLPGFFQKLPQARAELERRCGGAGAALVRQLQGEILYFSGRPDEAAGITGEQQAGAAETPTEAILLQCLLFRCHLAMGNPQEAEQCMLNLVRIARAHPKCLDSYQAMRTWANLTTGWSGETPRFSEVAGKTQPVLEDRLEAIQNGFSRMTALEKPFVDYAGHNYPEAYTLREYYMDIFHALYWFQVGDRRQTEAHFLKAYTIAAASGLIMPFVECGGQIVPLLHHIKNNCPACPPEWAGEILSLAEGYEESLNAYRT